jgi:prepilin-type N-terminal cleavage/methylation domain-containing protein
MSHKSLVISHKSGFTIPELLVALFVFSIGVGAALNLFLAGVSFQKSASSFEEFSSQTSAFFEYLSRSLRQAQKDLTPTCLSSIGLITNLLMLTPALSSSTKKANAKKYFLKQAL